nr:nucleotide disphospho-sugar-binding domain-containing protein [Cryobacterium roopkundense]
MPTTGHVRPGLGIAHALVAAGHEVSWYTGSGYGDMIRETGATFLPMSPGVDLDDDAVQQLAITAARKPGLNAVRWGLLNLFLIPIPGWFAELDEIAKRFQPDVVVVDHGFVAGLFLAEKRSIPSVAFSSTPLALSSVDTAPFGMGYAPSASAAGKARNRVLNASVQRVVFANEHRAANEVRQSLGLRALPSFFLNWHVELATRYLAATIPEFEYPRSDLPGHVQFIGALIPPSTTNWTPPAWWPDVAAIRESGRPVIVVTQGSVAREPRKLLLPAIQALATEDVLIVATTGGPDPELVLPRSRRPANLRLERFVPFDKLLPQADLMVTNGGYGGVQQALAAGVPLVVAGQTEDKMEANARVAWSRVGISLANDHPSPKQIAHAVDTVLTDPRYWYRARELAQSYGRLDATALAVEAITAAAAGR